VCAAACSELSKSLPYTSVYFICITTGADTTSADSTLLQLAHVELNDDVPALKVRTCTHTQASFIKNTLPCQRLSPFTDY
jgi:hypothetical protein